MSWTLTSLMKCHTYVKPQLWQINIFVFNKFESIYIIKTWSNNNSISYLRYVTIVQILAILYNELWHWNIPIYIFTEITRIIDIDNDKYKQCHQLDNCQVLIYSCLLCCKQNIIQYFHLKYLRRFVTSCQNTTYRKISPGNSNAIKFAGIFLCW